MLCSVYKDNRRASVDADSKAPSLT